jgi:hypothetical protein
VARLVWLLTGIAWAARSLLAFAHPDYSSPVTALDWAAVWTYSSAWLLFASSVLLIAKPAGSRSVTVIAAICATAAVVAGAANALEDGLRVPIGPLPYVVGFLVAWLSLVPLAIALARAKRGRLGVLCLAIFAGILLAFGYGGGVVVLTVLAALALVPGWFVGRGDEPVPGAPPAPA